MNAVDTTSFVSPNHSSRNGHAVSLLVLHATVGDALSSLRWLCNPQPKALDKRVSIHYLISKPGKVYQLVPEARSAWHAGASTWRGMGSYEIMVGSIGIELENANTGHDPYPQAQYTALLDLSRSLVVKYHILSDMVARHLDIATPKGRKSDPAAFPMEQFMTDLYVTRNNQSYTFRVRLDTQVGATIRAHADPKSERLMSVAAGTIVHGKVVMGELVTLVGFGQSPHWLELTDGGYIWMPLLEKA